MAALSRGLGDLGLRMAQQRIPVLASRTASKTCAERPMARVAHALSCSPILRAARNLQTSARVFASKQAAQAKSKSRPPAPAKAPAKLPEKPLAAHPPAKRAPTPPAEARPSPASLANLAEKLAARGPTILYQSPSHFWLRFSSLSAAFFLISYAGISYYTTIMHPPAGLAWWVPVAFAMVCLVSAGFGYLFLFASARIVRRITAVPTASLPASYLSGGSGGSKKANAALRASPIALECDVGGTLPLLGHRKLIAAPSQVLLPFKFVQAPVCRAAAAQKKVAGTDARPAEAVGRGSGGAFYGLRRGLTSEGFAPIMINGKRCKIDVLSGQVFDDGKVLDMLMPYRPGSFSDTWVDRVLKR